MEKIWEVTCSERDQDKWTKEVRLSPQDMIALLKMLLCRTLEPHEIIDSVTGKRPNLLEISEEGGIFWTNGNNLFYYTARPLE